MASTPTPVAKDEQKQPRGIVLRVLLGVAAGVFMGWLLWARQTCPPAVPPVEPTAVQAVEPPAAAPSSYVVGVVHFANGRSEIGSEAAADVRAIGAALAACPSDSITVAGMSSTAPFVTDSEHRNLTLASQRAHAIAKLLEAFGVQARIEPVTTSPERPFFDERRKPGAPNAFEHVNRFAEIRVKDPRNCGHSG